MKIKNHIVTRYINNLLTFSTTSLLVSVASGNSAEDPSLLLTGPEMTVEEHTTSSSSTLGLDAPYADAWDYGYIIGQNVTGSSTQVGIVTGTEGLVSLLDSEQINITNTGASPSGAIGLRVEDALLGDIKGTITTDALTESRALVIEGGSVGTISGTLSSVAQDGEAYTVMVDGGHIESIQGARIEAITKQESGVATGLTFFNGASAGDIHADIRVEGRLGQVSLIQSHAPVTLGTISGSYEMVSRNEAEITPTSYSVGYLLGQATVSTTTSLGFANTDTADSSGFNIDWSNIQLTVTRDYGFAAGAVLIGENHWSDTVIGKNTTINSNMTAGFSAGIWLNGSDMSGGDIAGTINAYTYVGNAYGLVTTGTGRVSSVVKQSAQMTTLGSVSGNIKAHLDYSAATPDNFGYVVGVQLGSIETVYIEGETAPREIKYTTEMTGSFGGKIEAVLGDYDERYDPYTKVVGIQDVGDSELKFKGGAEVSALVYDRGTQEAPAESSLYKYGDAINNTVGGIKLTTQNTSVSKDVILVGNLNAGEQALAFNEGHYSVSSSAWQASQNITFGSASSVEGLYATAQVNLREMVSAPASFSDTTTLSTGELNFYTNSMSDSSQLLVGEGLTLNFDGLTEVNVYLTGATDDYGKLYFVDAQSAAGFDADNTGITYNIYLNGSLYDQTEEFRLVHDASGIYLDTAGNDIIPEPSTVTLSLLALAGVLARRRRRVSMLAAA